MLTGMAENNSTLPSLNAVLPYFNAHKRQIGVFGKSNIRPNSLRVMALIAQRVGENGERVITLNGPVQVAKTGANP